MAPRPAPIPMPALAPLEKDSEDSAASSFEVSAAPMLPVENEGVAENSSSLEVVVGISGITEVSSGGWCAVGFVSCSTASSVDCCAVVSLNCSAMSSVDCIPVFSVDFCAVGVFSKVTGFPADELLIEECGESPVSSVILKYGEDICGFVWFPWLDRSPSNIQKKKTSEFLRSKS